MIEDPKEMQSYKLVSEKIQESLSDSEFVQFSRIVILNQDDPVVTYLQGLQTITNGGYKELSANEFKELPREQIFRGIRVQKVTKSRS